MAASHHHHIDLAVDTHSFTSHPYWHEIRTLGSHPHRRSYHSAVVWRNEIIVCGGQDLREGMVPGHWVFSFQEDTPEMDTWTELPQSDNMPSPLCRHTAVVDGNRMFLFGGTDNSIENSNTYILDLEARTWTVKLPDAPGLPPPIDSHSSVVHESRMIVFGGFIGGSRTSDAFELDLSSLRWSALATTGRAPCPRSSHTAVVYRNAMYVYGGSNDDGGKIDDVYRLSLSNNEWQAVALSGSVPEGRSGHSAVVYKSVMLVFGGMKDLTKETNEMHGLNLDSGEWMIVQEERKIEDPVSAAQLEEYKKGKSPTRRTQAVTGGSPHSGSPMHRSATLKQDSPVSPGDESPNTKKKRQPTHLYEGPPCPMLGRIVGRAPYPRDGHSAVLLGDRMFVFGGDRYQMPFNDLYVFAVNDYSVKTK